jgi:hypothetical protein
MPKPIGLLIKGLVSEIANIKAAEIKNANVSSL